LFALVVLSASCADGRSEHGGTAFILDVPFVPGERLEYSLHDDAGTKIAEGTLSVRRAGDSLELLQSYRSLNAASTDVASTLVHPDTLRPRLTSRAIEDADSKHEYRATYGLDSRTVELERDEEAPRTLNLPEHAYDNESSLWLWRALPLDEDFNGRYQSVNAVERSRQDVDLAVTGRQQIDVPAGTFDTWRLQVRNGRATRIAWVNIEAPHEIVQWDNGSVVFRLESKR
jgi:hypothetical protein